MDTFLIGRGRRHVCLPEDSKLMVSNECSDGEEQQFIFIERKCVQYDKIAISIGSQSHDTEIYPLMCQVRRARPALILTSWRVTRCSHVP
ncbi:hypothetical protein E2C01_007464 [Portunus trituberculatus]|uniref:Uncharacterized protein n=1 Tax=Portunus trituberculatus TaxID=210409 RepID=A0A5B7D4B3_PORTR|nr:hypothetical protein [Portunus trituberculatus]